jgi:hypothetical protein
MKSQTIFEFREKITTLAGGYYQWESPRLSTAFPIEGKPAGSDRAICRTVNGLVRVCYLGKQPEMSVTAGLFGEYAGLPGLIKSSAVFTSQPQEFDFFRNGNGVCFEQFITYSNLVERVFIRVGIVVYDNGLPANTMIPLEISGVLIASDPAVS